MKHAQYQQARRRAREQVHERCAAPERSKIQKVLDIYRQRSGVPFLTVQNMVVALYSPSLINTKKDKYKVDDMYENFLSKCENQMKYPADYMHVLKGKEREEERRDRALGRGRNYKVKACSSRRPGSWTPHATHRRTTTWIAES